MTIKIYNCFCLCHEQFSCLPRFFRRESTLEFPPHAGHCRARPFSPITGLCIRQCPPQPCCNSPSTLYPHFTTISLLPESCQATILTALAIYPAFLTSSATIPSELRGMTRLRPVPIKTLLFFLLRFQYNHKDISR